MFMQFFRFILGSKLATSRLGDEKFNVFWGMPLLSSDAISSVAYAVEEMLWILIPAVGVASYLWMPRVAGAIVILLFILTISYRQTVAAYPNGGGAYVVAKTNLSTTAGLVAGASLSVDYVLTVAVSISSGTAAITSAIPGLYAHRVAIAIFIIVLMVIGNLRGVKESSRIFSIPTYAFILCILALIVVGVFKHAAGISGVPPVEQMPFSFGTQTVTLFLLLRAFSSGCSAVTGVEAISNAVPNFQDPSVKNAKIAYALLAGAVFITFSGVAYLAKIFHPIPVPHETVISQIAVDVFGRGFMFYAIQATTAIILAMAANTAFAGFPTLLSVIAQDGYVPRQLALRGHRLNYSNGIIVLAALAIVLVIIFQGDTHMLIPLYAVGVFTSFTLSQTGMLRHWFRLKPEGWHYKAMINGLGAVVTLISVVIIGITKFTSGAWIVVLIIPVFVYGMMKVKSHYRLVAEKLDIPNANISALNLSPKFSSHIVIPVSSLSMMVIKALRYARSLTPNVEAFHVETFDGEADKLRQKWQLLNTNIPLVIKQSPYREVVGPLVDYICSEEHGSKPEDMVMVLLPQFIVPKWWQMAFHNNTSIFIGNSLIHRKNVVVAVLPFYLEEIRREREKIAREKEISKNS